MRPGTATSAGWKVMPRTWRTTWAPILMSSSWKLTSDQSAMTPGSLMPCRKMARL